MILTDEQQLATSLFQKHDHLKIEALAGTGKTSTLVALAASAPRERGVYLAFNSSVAQEARSRFHSGVNCSTSHALAFKCLTEEYGFEAAKLAQKPNVRFVEGLLQDRFTSLPLQAKQDGALRISKRGLATCILRTLESFYRSADDQINVAHVQKSISRFRMTPREAEHLFAMIKPTAEALWEQGGDKTSPTGLGHDGYLKLWAVRRARIGADYILLDEAQDTSDVLIGALQRQNCPVTLVGDPYQQIYEWRGAVNALDKFTSKASCALTESFRFGRAIAELAGSIIGGLGCIFALRGRRQEDTVIRRVSPTRAVLCKKNATVISHLEEALRSGKRVHVVGGTEELAAAFLELEKLELERICDHPELFGFDGLEEFRSFCDQYPEDAGVLGSVLRLKDNWDKRHPGRPITKLFSSLEPSQSTAELTISTVFKAKGLEWESVLLSDDFVQAGWISKEIRRLNYVACTRAKSLLSMSPAVYESIAF